MATEIMPQTQKSHHRHGDHAMETETTPWAWDHATATENHTTDTETMPRRPGDTFATETTPQTRKSHHGHGRPCHGHR